ncbi:hypothetical protein SBV1_3190008 [Verrucomicrobia bacterium]|nr:hypothetical protein SBV1_3190008 [Verrucomicrobiota bacterium]
MDRLPSQAAELVQIRSLPYRRGSSAVAQTEESIVRACAKINSDFHVRSTWGRRLAGAFGHAWHSKAAASCTHSRRFASPAATTQPNPQAFVVIAP